MHKYYDDWDPISPDNLVGYIENRMLVMAKRNECPEGTYTVKITKDLRGRVCPLCRNGWHLSSEGWHDQWTYDGQSIVHLSCHLRRQARTELNTYTQWIERAGVQYTLEYLPNGYWTDAWAQKPWYRFHCLGRNMYFDIGHRKSLTEISVIPSPNYELYWYETAAEVFKDELVTKRFDRFQVLLHAHTPEDGERYIKKLVW